MLPGFDNIRPGAVDDCFQFSLLVSGNREHIQCLLKIVQERLPLLALVIFKWVTVETVVTFLGSRTATPSPRERLWKNLRVLSNCRYTT